MRILMLALDYPPTVGGIAAHVYELARASALLGHEVIVLARQIKGRPPVDPDVFGLNIVPFELKWLQPLYRWQLRGVIRQAMNEFLPDILHFHGLGSLEGFHKQRIPLVYTNHTSGYLKKIQIRKGRAMVKLSHLFAPVDLILAPSMELLETPFPCTSRKKYIPNGIDPDKFEPNSDVRRQVRDELGIDDDIALGIVTRRMVEKNGVLYLARACSLLRDERIHFLFIGDGESRSAVEAELAQNFSGRYQMAGALRHDEIIRYYQAADFSVLPSLMEATSISGLEAMAAALPLVGTNVGGIPDLIDNGLTGFLCNPADPEDLASKIQQLLACDYRSMGQAGRHKVAHSFSWSIIAEKTVQAYSSTFA